MSVSKTQVDEIGSHLRDGTATSSDLEIFDDYRKEFATPYLGVLLKLKALGYTPTGRFPKRTESVILKLKRITVRLSQMQDIAGVRIVLPDMPEQDWCVASILGKFKDAKVVDRRYYDSKMWRPYWARSASPNLSEEPRFYNFDPLCQPCREARKNVFPDEIWQGPVRVSDIQDITPEIAKALRGPLIRPLDIGEPNPLHDGSSAVDNPEKTEVVLTREKVASLNEAYESGLLDAFMRTKADITVDSLKGLYRAVHVIVEETKPVEVQVRTRLQDFCANIMEAVADEWDLRYGYADFGPLSLYDDDDKQDLEDTLQWLDDTVVQAEAAECFCPHTDFLERRKRVEDEVSFLSANPWLRRGRS